MKLQNPIDFSTKESILASNLNSREEQNATNEIKKKKRNAQTAELSLMSVLLNFVISCKKKLY